MSRSRWTLPAGLAVLAAAAGVVLTFRRGEPENFPRRSDPSKTEAPARPAERAPVRNVSSAPASEKLPPPVKSPHSPGSREDKAWMETRISGLDELTWNDDAESLHLILAELDNPVPEIRAAALQATREFGSRDAVPFLQAFADRTGDPAERATALALIEHLKIPTLLEAEEEGGGE